MADFGTDPVSFYQFFIKVCNAQDKQEINNSHQETKVSKDAEMHPTQVHEIQLLVFAKKYY